MACPADPGPPWSSGSWTSQSTLLAPRRSKGGVTPESTAPVTEEGYPLLWAIAWRVRSASWIARHRELLERHACAIT
jgi:hypothetical protein